MVNRLDGSRLNFDLEPNLRLDLFNSVKHLLRKVLLGEPSIQSSIFLKLIPRSIVFFHLS